MLCTINLSHSLPIAFYCIVLPFRNFFLELMPKIILMDSMKNMEQLWKEKKIFLKIIVNENQFTLENWCEKMTFSFPIHYEYCLGNIHMLSQKYHIAWKHYGLCQQILQDGTGKKIVLTEIEEKILKYFFHKPEQTKHSLLHNVWGHENIIETRTLESHLYNLRVKMLSLSNPIDIVWQNGMFYMKEKTSAPQMKKKVLE